MAVYNVKRYVVTNLVETRDSAPYIKFCSIRDNKEQAKELLKSIVEDETFCLKEAEMEFKVENVNENETRVEESYGEYIATIQIHSVFYR